MHELILIAFFNIYDINHSLVAGAIHHTGTWLIFRLLSNDAFPGFFLRCNQLINFLRSWNARSGVQSKLLSAQDLMQCYCLIPAESIIGTIYFVWFFYLLSILHWVIRSKCKCLNHSRMYLSYSSFLVDNNRLCYSCLSNFFSYANIHILLKKTSVLRSFFKQI